MEICGDSKKKLLDFAFCPVRVKRNDTKAAGLKNFHCVANNGIKFSSCE